MIAPQAAELQRNIVRSHAVSVGEPLDREAVRAIMLMMVVNLGRGYSGVRPELMRQIVDMLNGDVVPYAPGEGSVGYLSVEAHVALVIMGEGRARVGAGAWLDGGAALRAAGLAPLSLACKEGLALLNGPGASNALAVLAVHDAVQAMDAADIAAALSLEMLRGTTRALDARYHAVKAHPEQRAAAAFVDGLLADSGIAAAARDQRLQDVLSLRAFPQTHGAARAFADHARMVIEREMASSGDNPIIWPTEDGDGSAMSGGNFDGSYVALACDSLAAALTMLGKSVERRIDRLVNAHFSGLPAFLSRAPGLNSGYMILQYTAAGLLGEMRSLAMPASIEGGSTCGNQEEPVSSAFNAAAKALRVAKKFEWLVAIELLAGCQAMEFHDVSHGLHGDARGACPDSTQRGSGRHGSSFPPRHRRHLGKAAQRTGATGRDARRERRPLVCMGCGTCR